MSASRKLDRKISSFALDLDMSIEIALREDARTTVAAAMVTSRPRMVSPAKKKSCMDNGQG